MRFTIHIVWMLALTGCATQAQMQAQNIAVSTQNSSTQSVACVRAIYDAREFEPLRPDIAFDPAQATLQQLTNTRKATPPQVQAIYFAHPRYKACQVSLMQNIGFATPSVVPTMADMYSRADDVIVDVVQQKITWGQYAQRMKSIWVGGQAQIAQEFQRIGAGLQQSHEAELHRRQAAANALAAYAQRQQLIDAMNRPAAPVITNCRKLGNTVNCISQ